MLFVPGAGRSGAELRRRIETSLGDAGPDLDGLSWSVDVAPQAIDLSYLRRRRAALLLMLALPGRPIFSPEYELRLHTSNADELGAGALLEMLELSRLSPTTAPARLRPSHAGRWQDENQVVFERHGAGPPDLAIANFSTVDAWLGDGLVLVQSHPGSGGENLLSDNDLLPPMTTCWFASK